MSMIKADPRRRRQLPMKGPLIFWRLGQDGISHVGLVVVVNACASPGCPCREATLMVHRVRDQLAGVELKGETILFSFPKKDGIGGSEFETARVLLADLDLDTGHVEVSKHHRAVQSTAPRGHASHQPQPAVPLWLGKEVQAVLHRQGRAGHHLILA